MQVDVIPISTLHWKYLIAGLLNVLADISGMLDPYMDASVHLLRAHVKEVIAVPKLSLIHI